MVSMESLTEFLGWCTLINAGLLIFASLTLIAVRTRLSKLHANMFGLQDTDLLLVYVQYLGQYKLAIIVLNLVPYLALRLMT